MFSTSYFIAILSGISLFIIGWAVSHYLSNRKSKDWKLKFLTLEKEHKLLTKKLNKETKLNEQLKHKAESWKQEYHASTKEVQDLRKAAQILNSNFEEQNNATQSELRLIKSDKDRAVTAHEKLQKDLEKLREKYKRDVSDGKEWRTERQKLERELKATTDKLEKTNQVAEEYKGKYGAQATEINKIRVLEREQRALKTKVKKLEDDCTYWEKKHFDAHHELAQLKKKSENLVTEYNELESLRKGDKILKDNLLSQIQEFKSKFVDVNNKYRELVNNN